ncbi:putative trehalose synthase [Saccharopolyspora lacisalsi]|uniref:Putative trehalose synthase n=1 Tax=Halosaccharopolyspora lacisalsi TaxID=1000566 RepID=A0A839E3L1_9PSEU|nr:putative trehalose synthase [Halosaccharopolyspora lacisalsi]
MIQVHVDPLAGVDLDELARRLAPRLPPHELAGVLRSAGYTVAGPDGGAGEQSPHCAVEGA